MRSIKNIFFATILIALATSIKAIVIECNFTTFSIDDSIHLSDYKSSNIYGCVVVEISDLSTPEVSVTGNHENLKGNDDVVGIFAKDKNLGDFLKNLGNVFMNVTDILIMNCTVDGIQLNQFENLENLVIIESDLKEIGENFFEDNEKLKKIWVQKNQILSKIDTKAFARLKELKILNLDENSCTKRENLNQNDVNQVLNVVKYMCGSDHSSIPNINNQTMQKTQNKDLVDHHNAIIANGIFTNGHLALNHPKLLNESQNLNVVKEEAQKGQNVEEKFENSVKYVQIITNQPTEPNLSTQHQTNPPYSLPETILSTNAPSTVQTPTYSPTESIIIQTPSTSTSDSPTPTTNINLTNSTTQKINSNTQNITQSLGDSEIPKLPIDIKANEKSMSESSGNGKAIAICVMFGAVVILMGAALLVKRKQTRSFDTVLLIDSTDV